MNKYVTILTFSSRENGNCTKIAQYISNHYHTRTNVSIFIVDSETFASCGKCNYECLRQDMSCPQLNERQITIMDTVCNSNLVYFIVPNYCGFPCANYFAYNERSVGYFNRNTERMEEYMTVPKRFVIVSNTEGFEDAMAQQTTGTPDILYLKSKKYRKHSVEGDLTDSEEAKADLDAFLHNNNLW